MSNFGQSSSLAGIEQNIRWVIYLACGQQWRDVGWLSLWCHSLPGKWPGLSDKKLHSIIAKLEQQIL